MTDTDLIAPDDGRDIISQYDTFRLPDWAGGRVPVVSRYRVLNADTLRRTVDRLDAAGDREAADTIVWLLWWKTIADNRAQLFINEWQKACDSDGNPKGGDGTAPSRSDDSAGREAASPDPSAHAAQKEG